MSAGKVHCLPVLRQHKSSLLGVAALVWSGCVTGRSHRYIVPTLGQIALLVVLVDVVVVVTAPLAF